MRVSQVQSLLWVGNVLLVGIAGWLGWQFWQAKKAPPPEPAEWQSTEAVAIGSSWPGPFDRFKLIPGPFNGLVPPPPRPVDAEKPKAPPADEQLRQKMKIDGAIVAGAESPNLTTVNALWEGKQKAIVLGDTISDTVGGKTFDWVLTSIEGRRDGSVVATFFSRDFEKNDGTVSIEMPAPKTPEITAAGGPVKPIGKGFDEKPPRDRLEQQAFRNAEGEWQIPAAEVEWWDAWGEELVYAKLKTQDVKDPQGNPVGVKFMSSPGEGTVVAAQRGISQGDTIKSINGFPMGSMKDVFAYMKTAKDEGTRRFVVVLERDGAEKRVVYNLWRRPHP